jgi:hypothetical protein
MTKSQGILVGDTANEIQKTCSSDFKILSA